MIIMWFLKAIHVNVIFPLCVSYLFSNGFVTEFIIFQQWKRRFNKTPSSIHWTWSDSELLIHGSYLCFENLISVTVKTVIMYRKIPFFYQRMHKYVVCWVTYACRYQDLFILYFKHLQLLLQLLVSYTGMNILQKKLFQLQELQKVQHDSWSKMPINS